MLQYPVNSTPNLAQPNSMNSTMLLQCFSYIFDPLQYPEPRCAVLLSTVPVHCPATVPSPRSWIWPTGPILGLLQGWTTAASVAALSEPRTETVKYQRTDEGRRGRKWARLETVFDSQLKAQHCGNFHSYSLLTYSLYTWWLLLGAIWSCD
jgi:hypothetical protein